LNLFPEKRKGEPDGSPVSEIVLESISRDQRGCHKNDGVVRRVRQKWRGRRIRLDPQPGVDDAHHEDDADLETRDAGLRKVTEREYGGYRNTHNSACVGNSLSEPPLGQAEEVPAKYGLFHAYNTIIFAATALIA